ncbi:MAG: class I SAM-dependent methyltransferase [Terrimicrobiaceae bacterium]
MSTLTSNESSRLKAAFWALSEFPALAKPARWFRRKLWMPSPETILATLDAKALNAVRQIHAPGASDQDLRTTLTQRKYLDPLRQIHRNLRRASELDLYGRPPLEILDLGCGSGYFLKISGVLGHTATGFDLDESDIYRDLIASLGVRRVIGRIEAFEPVPGVESRFDLITAFAICFNDHSEQVPWGCDPWEYFLKDVASRLLKPQGKIVLKLNPREGEVDDARFYTPELRAFFERLGATMEGPLLTFRRKPILSKTGVAL